MEHIEGRFVYGDDVYIPDEYLDEVWEYIPGIQNYMISNYGRVWSEKSQVFLKPKKMDREGHMGFCLHDNGVPHYVYQHRIMAEAFIPNPECYPIVRHLNDIPDDNDLLIGKNLQTGEARKFRGQNEAGRILGIQQANIFKVLNGERRQTGGWTFEYEEIG